MSKLKKIVFIVAAFIVLGAIAKAYNTQNHERMAVEQCGSIENVKHFDELGFECVDD